MILSRAFRDMVSRATLKGVVRRNGEFCIDRHELSQHRMKSLVDTAMQDFGYPTVKEAREDIISAFMDSAVEKANRSEVNQVDLHNIAAGSILFFKHDGGYGLRLIVAADGGLVVLDDEENILVKGDILHCLGLRIHAGKSSVFQVVRYGEQYPSKDLYLNLEEINTLAIQVNDGENLLIKYQTDNAYAVNGLTTAYSLHSSLDGSYFSPTEFTEDITEALFKIHFNPASSISFEFNEDYTFKAERFDSKSLRSEYEDTLQKILKVCEYDEACLKSPIGKIRSHGAGILRPYDTVNGDIILQVIEKACIGL